MKAEAHGQPEASLPGRSFHTDPKAAAAARAAHASAYTVGRDVVFAHGTAEGRGRLAHELTHVVQQAGGTSGGAAAPRGEGHEIPF